MDFASFHFIRFLRSVEAKPLISPLLHYSLSKYLLDFEIISINLNNIKKKLIGKNNGLRAAPTHTPLTPTRRQVLGQRGFIFAFQ
jgi:hypothetical protein